MIKGYMTTDALILFFLFFSLTIAIVIKSLQKKFSFLPFAPTLFVISIVMGKYSDHLGLIADSIKSTSGIDLRGILLIFLPPLIFESSFSSDWYVFRKQASQIFIPIYLVNYIQQMNNQKDSNRITIITLASAIIGFFTWTHHPIYSVLFIGIMVFPKYIAISQFHSWIAIARLTSTTFVFGLINGWTLTALNEYFQNPQQNRQLPVFSIYLSLLTVYHYFQFQLVNNFHHKTIEWKSFLIYHSKSYTIANTFSITQHLLTRYVFEFDYKIYNCLMIPALIVAVIGEGLRIAAFFTCKSNFTHLVRFSKVPGHTLITHGIYSFFRHPSYTGFFYFSVFSQFYLGNFLSFILFAIALRKFFQERIEFEEQALLKFFPQYLQYKKKTHILIPFVKDPNFYQKYGASEQQQLQQIKKSNEPLIVLSTDSKFHPDQQGKDGRQTSAPQFNQSKKSD